MLETGPPEPRLFPGCVYAFALIWSCAGPISRPGRREAPPARFSTIGWRRYPFLDVNKSVTCLTAQFISSRSNLPVHAGCFDAAATVCVCVLGGVGEMCQLALWYDYRREML